MIFPGSLLSGVVAEFGIFDLPYLIRDHNHAMRVADELTKSEMSRFARRANLELIAMLDGGFRNLISKEPIKGLSDLDGKTILISRTTIGNANDVFLKDTFQSKDVFLNTDPNSTPSAKYFSRLGAEVLPSPTFASFTFFQTFGAVQELLIGSADVIDGQLETLPESVMSNGFKNVTLTRHAFVPLFVVASQAAWSRLSPSDQNAIQLAASEIQKESFEKGLDLNSVSDAEFKNWNVSESAGDPIEFSNQGKSSSILREITASFTFQHPETVELLNDILRLSPR